MFQSMFNWFICCFLIFCCILTLPSQMEHCLLSTQCFLISVINVQARYKFKKISLKLFTFLKWLSECTHKSLNRFFFWWTHVLCKYIFIKSWNLMIQIWWHFNCINTMLSKKFFGNYCFQFCTESLCMKVGQTPGDWEECSVSMPDQLTIKQKEQLCYLACSKWYIFFSLPFDKKTSV